MLTSSKRGEQQHVNNANYIRYAESARVNWIIHFASLDPVHRQGWRELMMPISTGLIMKSIKAEYKFVRLVLAPSPVPMPLPPFFAPFRKVWDVT